ncbi:redoxin domain-containing protein [Halegenticoccus tardaugens]|uniref:redoxin domain-containing protein n=1 Tax=Halegenticoccus tardaugens TaxID=2071624 RepID=UPI00100B638D|nr:redoxin domain-containing protein [Halegenticoccus tardaugens]
MLEIGDEPPDFTVPMACGNAYNDVSEFHLAEVIDEGIVVLAFFPAAFTGGCTEELCSFRDSMRRFNECNAKVYGISVDLPPAQNIFIQQLGLNFALLSDFEQNVIEAYGTIREELYGVRGVARRSVFVIADGTIQYRWVRCNDERPDYTELVATIGEKVETLA